MGRCTSSFDMRGLLQALQMAFGGEDHPSPYRAAAQIDAGAHDARFHPVQRHTVSGPIYSSSLNTPLL